MAVSSPDSPSFINQLKAQDHGAFNTLVKEHHRRLVSLAGTIVGLDSAEEVTQDAWISIFRALPRFESRSLLKTWLFTIVRNEALACLKKESRINTKDLNKEDGQDFVDSWFETRFANDGHWSKGVSEWNISSPEAMLQEEQLRHCIEHTLTILRADQKAVFLLRDLEQIPMEEICNILQFSHSNARVLLHRARLRLMQVIEKYQETGEC